MIIPIISYGHSVLRQVCKDIDSNYPGLEEIIVDLTDTLDAANGLGLAGPQINKAIKVFIVDTKQVYEQMDRNDRASYFPDDTGIKEVFINARIIKSSNYTVLAQEGCLSIPSIVEEIGRNWIVEIEYFNRLFQKQSMEINGITARAIQHEIDHTAGILFIDYLSNLKKKLLRSTLSQISNGKVNTNYPMKFMGRSPTYPASEIR